MLEAKSVKSFGTFLLILGAFSSIIMFISFLLQMDSEVVRWDMLIFSVVIGISCYGIYLVFYALSVLIDKINGIDYSVYKMKKDITTLKNTEE